jgi:hypothetical protein
VSSTPLPALLGICPKMEFEAQAAIALEQQRHGVYRGAWLAPRRSTMAGAS